MMMNRRLFLRQVGVGAAGLGLAGLPSFSWAARAAAGLPRSAPESQGVASGGILDFVNAVETSRLHLHSLMVARRGHVVAEGWWAPYASDLRHTLYSLSKSFTSTGVGLAAAEGKLKLDDKVVSHFPDDLPATISPNLAAMSIRDLLRMRAGHKGDSLFGPGFSVQEKNWVKSVLAKPVEHAPGTHFAYNNGATFLLSAIVQKTTGQTLHAYLTPRLFEPLGIEGSDWEQNPQGINCGAWGLRVRTEDIARLGQLYLQMGQWNGKRLLSDAWVTEAALLNPPAGAAAPAAWATSPTSDWAQGYGFQFWRSRNGAYRGDGAFGQYCIVMPKQEMVIAITAETNEMQAVLDATWKHLLPAAEMKAGGADGSAAGRLKEKLASLTLPHPAGQAASPMAARMGDKTFAIEKNSLGVESVSISFQKEKAIFKMKDAQGEHEVACGLGRWATGRTAISPAPLHLVREAIPGETTTPIAVSGAWSDEKTFTMFWRFTETAHYQSVACRMEGDDLRVEFKKSAAILSPGGKDGRPVLIGKPRA